jgi:hypothetical protein
MVRPLIIWTSKIRVDAKNVYAVTSWCRANIGMWGIRWVSHVVSVGRLYEIWFSVPDDMVLCVLCIGELIIDAENM